MGYLQVRTGRGGMDGFDAIGGVVADVCDGSVRVEELDKGLLHSVAQGLYELYMSDPAHEGPDLILATKELIVTAKKGVVDLSGFFEDWDHPSVEEMALFEIELGITYQEYVETLV